MTKFGLAALDLPGLGPELRDMLLSAAVQERVQPSALLMDWMESHAAASPALLDDAMNVALSLGAVMGASAEAPAGGELPLNLRRQILSSAGRKLVHETLVLSKIRTQAEHSFADLVAGRSPDLDEMTRADLVALATAASWSEGLDGATWVPAAAIEARLRDQNFVERVGGTDLGLFVGRASLLNALCRIWAQPNRPVVLVEGPGGIGKSIAVARFFQIVLSGTRDLPRPNAILHLDFDLPTLQRATEIGLVTEIVRQLALRWTTGSADGLLSLVRGLGGDLEHNEGVRAQTSQTSIRDARTWETPTRVLREALARFVPASVGPPKIILFADSFERAERLDEVVAFNVRQIVAALTEAGADVMAIYAGRAFRNAGVLDPGLRPSVQHVRRFRQGEAVDYLIAKARQRGFNLQRRDADRANKTLNGWPLGLRIAVSMFGTSPETFDPKAWIAAIEGSGSQSVQVTLYQRLLDRITDDDLRKLAKPGLLVRRLSGPVIEQVLAGPCGLAPPVNGAAMMARAEAEGQLFIRDIDDPGALWHRQDLREVMLPALRKEVDAVTTRAIHDLAVTHYGAQSGDIARAEELYHRLFRGDPAAEIASRWNHAAGQRLVAALDELPAEPASILRKMLGGGRSDLSGVGGEAQIEELRSVARNRLADGATDLTDLFTQAGVPEAIRSPLGDIAAEVMARQGHFAEVIDTAEDLPGMPDVPLPVKARIAITAAGLAEGLGDLPRALRLWRMALRLKDHLQPLEELTVRTALARLFRKTRAPASTRRHHVLAAQALLDTTIGAVRSNRVLRLETVAELSGGLRPGTAPSPDVPAAKARAALALLFREMTPMYPSAGGNRSRLEEIARTLGHDPDRIQTPFELDRITSALFGGQDRRGHQRALDALRGEVDFAFATVVDREKSDAGEYDPDTGPSRPLPSFDYA